VTSEVVKQLLGYGVLGIVALVEGIVIARLYRDLRTMEERHQTKAENWITHYHEHHKRISDLLESISKRR
jgi:hypothetical protein